MIKEHTEQDNIMMTTTHHRRMPDGLKGGHAYTLLGAKVYTDADKKSHHLIKVRNPWGREGYSGKFSDESEEMNKNNGHALKALGHQKNKRDGVFYIPFEDYYKNFRCDVFVDTRDWKRAHRMA
jgi:hypothetical protein